MTRVPQSVTQSARPRGRPLAPRSDTERLDVLVELIGFGQNRADVEFAWENSGLEIWSHKAGAGRSLVAGDQGGDPRTLLDRVISKRVTAKKRAKRSRRRGDS